MFLLCWRQLVIEDKYSDRIIWMRLDHIRESDVNGFILEFHMFWVNAERCSDAFNIAYIPHFSRLYWNCKIGTQCSSYILYIWLRIIFARTSLIVLLTLVSLCFFPHGMKFSTSFHTVGFGLFDVETTTSVVGKIQFLKPSNTFFKVLRLFR